MESSKRRKFRGLPDYVTVGRVTAPHGVRGEVRVMPVETTVERLLQLTHVYLRRDGGGSGSGEERRRVAVRNSREHRGMALMALEGVKTRDEAESLRGYWVEVAGTEVPPLEPGRFYVFELIGCRVETTEGLLVGHVEDVLTTGANDVYVVRSPDGREHLVPAVKAMVKGVDVEEGRIVIDPWPGLLDAGDE